GAGRDVVAELGVSGMVIGGDRLRVRIVLVETYRVRQVRAELLQDAPHALQDEIALAAAARQPVERKTGRPGYRRRRAGSKIDGLVTGQEQPRAGLDCIGVRERGSEQMLDRLDLDARHCGLPRILKYDPCALRGEVASRTC